MPISETSNTTVSSTPVDNAKKHGNNKTDNSKTPTQISNTSFSFPSASVPIEEVASKLNLPKLSQDFNKILSTYATNKKKEKERREHQERLKKCLPDFSIDKPNSIAFENSTQISDTFNKLLKDVDGKSSSLYKLLNDFAKKNQLGKIKEEKKAGQKFVFKFNESLPSLLSNAHSSEIKLAPPTIGKNVSENDPFFREKETIFEPSSPYQNNNNAHTLKVHEEYQSNNPFGDEEEIFAEEKTSNYTEKKSEDSVALSSAHLTREANESNPFGDENDTSKDQLLAEQTAYPARSHPNLSENVPRRERASSVSQSLPPPYSAPQSAFEVDAIDSSSSAPSQPEALFPDLIYKVNQDSDNIKYKNLRKIGHLVEKNIYIDFKKLPVELFGKEVTNLPYLCKALESFLNLSKESEKALNYIKEVGLEEIISIKKEGLLHKEWKVNFSPSFILTTMTTEASDSSTLIDEFASGRNTLIKELNKYIEDKDHLKKLRETLEKTPAGSYLAITNNTVIWIDEKTWPKNNQNFDNILKYIAERHGDKNLKVKLNKPIVGDAKVEIKSKSSLINKNLRNVYQELPGTQFGSRLRETKEAQEDNIIAKNLSKLDKDEKYYLTEIIKYAKKDLKKDGINNAIDKLVFYHIYKSKPEKKAEKHLDKVKQQDLKTNTNRNQFQHLLDGIFEKVHNFIAEPKTVSQEHTRQFSRQFVELASKFSSAVDKNKNEIKILFDSKLKEILQTIQSNLIDTGSDTETADTFNIIKEKLTNSFHKQKLLFLSHSFREVDNIMHKKIIEAVNTFNLKDTDQSGPTLEEWFITFNQTLGAYHSLQSDLIRLLETELEESPEQSSYVKEIVDHFHTNHAYAQQLVSQKLLENIETMNFFRQLEKKLDDISKNPGTNANKAEKIKNIMGEYKGSLRSALSLLDKYDKAAAIKLKGAQSALFNKFLEEMRNTCPKPVSRFGRIKEMFLGIGKKFSFKDFIANGINVIKTMVAGLATLVGGTALTIGVLSAAGIGVLAPFFVPLMLPVATAAFIIGGAVILAGVVGFSIYSLKGEYAEVRRNNLRVANARAELEKEIAYVSEALRVA